jgi:flavin-dependent dehydrogenase
MNDYDVIVVGTRIAGSSTALLLAHKGYRVLAPGVAALRRWGLLDRLAATGCPPIRRYSFDFGPCTIRGAVPEVDGVREAYAPRRTVLDTMLVDAARQAGVDVQTGFNVDGLLRDPDGRIRGIRNGSADVRAGIVIGADGRNSRVAKTVRAAEYHPKPRVQYAFYSYFSGLPVDGVENYIRARRGWGCAPTHDGLTMIIMGWPYAEARAFKADVPGNFARTIGLSASFAARFSRAHREAPFLGGAVAGWLRKPYGDGWALVGDAGYNKDPITAQGITDALLDAERCSAAVDSWLRGEAGYEQAMSAWHRERDTRVMPMYEFTSQLATLEPPPPAMQQLVAAIAGDQTRMDTFVGAFTGAVSPADYFSQDNIGRILRATRITDRPQSIRTAAQAGR